MFMGAEHPDFKEDTPLTGMGSGVVRRAIEQAKSLGILDKHVFFNFGWATNEEAEDYLLESDLGVCTYFDSMETRFSFRVRYLDLFWARLPIICTEGDVVADMVSERGLGLTVPEGDVDALTAAIARLVDDDALRSRCREDFSLATRAETALLFLPKRSPAGLSKEGADHAARRAAPGSRRRVCIAQGDRAVGAAAHPLGEAKVLSRR
jgi:glycosyltransferase involved in cell wall biosynthesis